LAVRLFRPRPRPCARPQPWGAARRGHRAGRRHPLSSCVERRCEIGDIDHHQAFARRRRARGLAALAEPILPSDESIMPLTVPLAEDVFNEGMETHALSVETGPLGGAFRLVPLQGHGRSALPCRDKAVRSLNDVYRNNLRRMSSTSSVSDPRPGAPALADRGGDANGSRTSLTTRGRKCPSSTRAYCVARSTGSGPCHKASTRCFWWGRGRGHRGPAAL